MSTSEHVPTYWMVNTHEGYDYYEADYITLGSDNELYVQDSIDKSSPALGRLIVAAYAAGHWLSFRQINEKAYSDNQEDQYV